MHFNFRPENGQYSTALDEILIKEARGLLS
jgi:hypothetical protein